jgi:Tol biopolymer transport system component
VPIAIASVAWRAGGAAAPREARSAVARSFRIVGAATSFAPGVASTGFAEVRLTLSPDGRTALWFARNRPGGPGGYDIWMSRRAHEAWSPATPVSFNSDGRDFDPAFSADGRFVYFCSDRPGGRGGDDIYRVAVAGEGFGRPQHLGASVNSSGNEFAPMLSPDGSLLLFSSDRPGGPGGHDLFVARLGREGFQEAERLPGEINTSADEFDATFLADGSTVVFARAQDLRKDRIDLFCAVPADGRYGSGVPLPRTVNDGEKNTYGPMLDWSQPARLTFSGQRDGAPSMDLYLVDYRLE